MDSMDSVTTKVVTNLIEKAGKSERADDALKFSQAACNAGNAYRVMIDAIREAKEGDGGFAK